MANKSKSAKSEKTAEKAQPVVVKKTSGQTIAITILATVLVCIVVVFAVLALTGVIKFGGESNGSSGTEVPADNVGTGDNSGNSVNSSNAGSAGTSSSGSDSKIVDNPNKRVAVKGTLAEVGDLEFYLPSKFEAGGKNSNGAYTYNLVNDDGWAQVVVYAEKSSLSPSEYLLKQSPYLDITDTNYKMNGTNWVQGENASMLAYATKLDGKVYAVIYSVKLDSDATSEAMSMIPKTLYMKKVYKN